MAEVHGKNPQYIIERFNPRGLRFLLLRFQHGTKVHLGAKSIVVDLTLEDMSQCWYDWQMRRQLIQNAFPTLSADQREFFQTGMTPDEWNAMFGKDGR